MTHVLPIWSEQPLSAVLSAVKEAKQQIPDAPLIQPVRSVPGSPGRVLAIGTPPPFLCDYALVGKPEVDRLQVALEWTLGLREDERGMTVLKKLQQIFGAETREITDEDVLS